MKTPKEYAIELFNAVGKDTVEAMQMLCAAAKAYPISNKYLRETMRELSFMTRD